MNVRFDENIQTHKDEFEPSPNIQELSEAQQESPKIVESVEEGKEGSIQTQSKPLESNDIKNERFDRNWKHKSNHLKNLIIGEIEDDIKTRSKHKENISILASISEIESKEIGEALSDES